MPVYEYNCGKCGKDFEELIRTAADERKAECPTCGSRTVSRKPSVFAARAAVAPLPRGGCGRCGDPDGPCARE